jgi:hypothetical protein
MFMNLENLCNWKLSLDEAWFIINKKITEYSNKYKNREVSVFICGYDIYLVLSDGKDDEFMSRNIEKKIGTISSEVPLDKLVRFQRRIRFKKSYMV